METDNASYQSQQPALQHVQQPLALQNTPQQAISHIQQPALQQKAISYEPQQQIMQYSQQLQQVLQPAALQDTQSKMELGYNPQQALTYNQGSHQQLDFTQPQNYNQHICK